MKNQIFYRRLIFSLNGLKAAFKSEKSFRTQLVIILPVLVSLVVLKASAFWWAIHLLVIGVTLAAELLNTSIEYVIDVLHPGVHPKLGSAKDIAAGAVLVLSLSALLIFFIFMASTFNLI
jgi:undecaprenol kinase